MVIDKLPGVGPLSPPQAVNPRIEIQERMNVKTIWPMKFARFMRSFGLCKTGRISDQKSHSKETRVRRYVLLMVGGMPSSIAYHLIHSEERIIQSRAELPDVQVIRRRVNRESGGFGLLKVC